MIFFLVLGLWSCRPFPIPSRNFAPRCKESDGSHSALRVAVRCNALTERGGYSSADLFRCERGDDFFEARIAAQWVPERVQFQLAVGYPTRNLCRDRQLLQSKILFADPCANDGKALDHVRTADRVSRDGEKLNGPSSFAQRLFLTPKSGVDQAE